MPPQPSSAAAEAEFIRRFAQGAGLEPEAIATRDAGDLAEMLGMLLQICAGNVGQLYGEGTKGFNTRTFDINGKLEDGKLVGFTTDKHRQAAEVGLVHRRDWVPGHGRVPVEAVALLPR